MTLQEKVFPVMQKTFVFDGVIMLDWHCCANATHICNSKWRGLLLDLSEIANNCSPITFHYEPAKRNSVRENQSL